MHLLPLILSSYLVILSSLLSAAEKTSPVKAPDRCEALFTLTKGLPTFNEAFYYELVKGKDPAEVQEIYERLKDLPKLRLMDRAVLWTYQLPYGSLSSSNKLRMWEVLFNYKPKELYKLIFTPMDQNLAWKTKNVQEQQAIVQAAFYLLGYSVKNWSNAKRMRRWTNFTANILAKLKSGDSGLINRLHRYYVKLNMYTPFHVFMSPNNRGGIIARVFKEDLALHDLAKMVADSNQNVPLKEAVNELIEAEILRGKYLQGVEKLNSNVWLYELNMFKAFLETPQGKSFNNFSSDEIQQAMTMIPSGASWLRLPRSVGSVTSKFTRFMTKLVLSVGIAGGGTWSLLTILGDTPDLPAPLPTAEQIQTIKVQGDGSKIMVSEQQVLNEFEQLNEQYRQIDEDKSLSPTEAFNKKAEVFRKIQQIIRTYPDINQWMIDRKNEVE